MALLLRIGIFVILLGLVLGFVLRRFRPGHQPEAVLLAAVPWLVHALYAVIWAIATYRAPLGGALVGLLEVAAAVLVLRLGPRLYRADNRRAALIPLLLLATHGLLLWVWSLTGEVSFRVLPTLYLIAGTLLGTSALFTYAWPRPIPSLRRR